MDYSDNGSYVDYNFNTFYRAFLTVFVVLTGDNWSGIYFAHYLSAGPLLSTVFFLTLIVFGNYILINLFIAMLLKNFDDDSFNQQ